MKIKTLIRADRVGSVSLGKMIDTNPGIELLIFLWDLYYQDVEQVKNYPNIPAIGVYGNHCDGRYLEDNGIRNLHLKTWEYKGVTFWGFEGYVRYKKGMFQYTQEEALELIQSLPRVDILICHCPPFWINEGKIDHAHIGFQATLEYIKKFKPKYLFHGHTYDDGSFVESFGETKIVYVEREMVMEMEM